MSGGIRPQILQNLIDNSLERAREKFNIIFHAYKSSLCCCIHLSLFSIEIIRKNIDNIPETNNILCPTVAHI